MDWILSIPEIWMTVEMMKSQYSVVWSSLMMRLRSVLNIMGVSF